MPIDMDRYNSPAAKGDVAMVAIKCARLSIQVVRLVSALEGGNKALIDQLKVEISKVGEELDASFDELVGWSRGE